MKKFQMMLLILLIVTGIGSPICATDAAVEFKHLASEVAALELGFGEYILGSTLTLEQKQIATLNRIEKSIDGTYKFKDGDVFVIAKIGDDTILGIYKEYNNLRQDKMKSVVGDLMMRFDEPTIMAHEKLIYWAYDKNGRIPDEVYAMRKNSGGNDVLGLVKFVSSSSIGGQKEKMNKDEVQTEKVEDPSVYVIISSDPLSKLFLAMNG